MSRLEKYPAFVNACINDVKLFRLWTEFLNAEPPVFGFGTNPTEDAEENERERELLMKMVIELAKR